MNTEFLPQKQLKSAIEMLLSFYPLHIGKAGRIIEEIQARGFHVFGIQSFILTKKESEDFYEIYKGIEARDYFGLVRQGIH
jgi:hypothetical protein